MLNPEQLGWRGIADVAALTLLAFVVYLWLRGTVAVRVLGGLAALLAASLAAERLGLIMTSRLLQGVSAGGVLLIAIVFRDEIRSALRRADPTAWARRWWSGRPPPHRDLASAAVRLATKRIGALLVVPRGDDVTPHVSGGSQVGARVGADLLEALFHPRSPLHDGAAIIAGGRVQTAGVLLPLSTAGVLPVGFGTRHRAALGLSRACDALVIAVSEERGTVTLVADGELAPGSLEPDALAEQIAKQVTDPAARAGHGSTRFRPPWRDAVALVAIMMAIASGRSYLIDKQPIVLATEAPIELRNVGSGTEAEIVGPASGNARVRVRGSPWLLDPSRLDQVRIWAQVQSLEPGWHEIELRVDAPDGIDVLKLSPPKATVKISTAD